MSLKAASTANIALLLAHQAAERPLSPAIVEDGRSISFGALDDECARLGAGLESIGIRRGARCVLMVPPGVEMIALAFSLFRIGAVPVFVDPGVGWNHLKDCLGQARPDAFIGSPKAHLGRVLGAWGKGTIKTLVVARGFFPGATGLGVLRRGAGKLRAPHAPKPGETAALLYTSGSTGTPKGAVYTHEMFNAQADLLRRLFSIEAGQASVPTFPLFALFDVALGLTAHIPRMDFTKPGSVDPREILGKIQGSGAAQLFGSPALIDRVGRHAEQHGVRLPTVKRVLSAGAPVPARTLSRFAALLDGAAEVHTPYGATEALPVATVGSRELSATAQATAAGAGVCVGRPVPGVEVAVIETSDEPVRDWKKARVLPQGEIGEICVKGPVVSAAYFEKPEANALAKIPDGDAVRHRMGDLGYLDAEGRLWFCGRKSQRVEAGGETLHTVCCEGVLNAHPAVRRSALVGPRVDGEVVPAACVELEEAARGEDRAKLREELLALAARHEASRRVKAVLFHPAFPVDARHNAKIKRERLAVWAGEQLGAAGFTTGPFLKTVSS
jgi:acyl-CoA synthetase (AMP-forming)/AMP-acid ligase II